MVTGLPRKDIEVALIAWSGEQASEPGRLKLHWAGPPLEDLLKPKLYALVIGVSDYVAANLKLEYAAKDAIDFSEALQAQEGGMYSKVEVKRLVDREVTREAIVDGLEWLEQQVTHRDIGIIFVAGHGVKDDQQTYWFLPADATQARLRAKAVPQDDLRRTLRNLAGKAILFVDTCHAGQVMREARRGSADIDALINDFRWPRTASLCLHPRPAIRIRSSFLRPRMAPSPRPWWRVSGTVARALAQAASRPPCSTHL